MLKIGPYQLSNNLILAPMAGITDQPFRDLCLDYGAGMAISEMMSSNPRVWQTSKSRTRQIHSQGIRSVQIAGADPKQMAEAAQFCVAQGAQIIDINMGCPAKKVNKKLAGSALLKYPELIKDILTQVVQAVEVPVTLKTRTGWDKSHKNCVEIAKLAQACGIQAITLHGRTRECMYKGEAEYDSIKAVKSAIDIPVIANGDIDSPEKAKFVLDYTNADGLMIGRASQGRPWIFTQIQHFLKEGTRLAAPSHEKIKSTLLEHVQALHHVYGAHLGPRIARKHVGWYLKEQERINNRPNSSENLSDFSSLNWSQLRRHFNLIQNSHEQLDLLETYF